MMILTIYFSAAYHLVLDKDDAIPLLAYTTDSQSIHGARTHITKVPTR